MALETPYYLIDEKRLLKNLKIIRSVRDRCGAKSLLALKCFSSWSVFGLMSRYMDGTTSSSPYEARLGYEKFGKEVHAYSVGYSGQDLKEVSSFADKVIFNSLSQLKMFYSCVRGCRIGIRINPRISYSCFDLADPAREYSRLGVADKKSLIKSLPLISGAMFHFNCENKDFNNFSLNIDYISRYYGDVLKRLEWVSLGGGIYFTKEGYPLDRFCRKLKEFSRRFGVQVYLEPGESAVTESTQLVTRVLDIVRNQIAIAIVDASTEAHMLDLLIYGINAKIENSVRGRPDLSSDSLECKVKPLKGFKYMVAGRSCLAGDVFGTYNFRSRLRTGSIIKFADAGGYTMVKKNWFNGLKMPSIAVKRLDGSIDVVRRFNYKDFLNSLS